MSDSNRYVLDANVFIEAKNKYYGFSLCPGFWNALLVQHINNRIFSIDKVLAELVDEGDELSDWSKDRAPDTFFKKTQDQAVITLLGRMVEWVNAQPQFTPAAKAEFASTADGWVVAHAKVNGLTVVTHEEFAPDAKKEVPIPNVCLEFDVNYCKTFEMLDDLKVKFILSTKRQRRK